MSLPVSTKQWSAVATDLFEYEKKHYLVCVDSYSGYPEVERIQSQTSAAVISVLQKIFSRQGIPDILYSDNGPCYSSNEFKKFTEEWELEHQTSSPLYPKSNGLAERMVQTVKNIFKKCDESGENKDLGLLVYRATPLECGESPAKLLGRNLKTNLPFNPKPQCNDKIVNSKVVQKVKQQFYHDRQAKELPSLKSGNSVRVRDEPRSVWGDKAVVIDRSCGPRSYLVRTERGAEYRRNRKDLLRTDEPVYIEEQEPQDIVDEPAKATEKQEVTEQPRTPARNVVVKLQAVQVPEPGRTRSGRRHVKPKRLIEEE